MSSAYDAPLQGQPADFLVIPKISSTWHDAHASARPAVAGPFARHDSSRSSGGTHEVVDGVVQVSQGVRNSVMGAAYDIAHWSQIPTTLLPNQDATPLGKLRFVFGRDDRPMYFALLALLVAAIGLGAHAMGTRSLSSSHRWMD